MKKKSFVMVLALVLVLAVAVGGVVAWLTDKTGSVVNTFTVGDINIELKETTGNSYQVIPGTPIHKDPTVTVKANSEACWLFVKVDKANWNDNLTYTIAGANDWTVYKTDGNTTYYYQKVDATGATAKEIVVLDGNAVNVSENLAKGEITAEPTLTFTAAAVQQENITTVDKAFAQLPGEFTGATAAP